MSNVTPIKKPNKVNQRVCNSLPKLQKCIAYLHDKGFTTTSYVMMENRPYPHVEIEYSPRAQTTLEGAYSTISGYAGHRLYTYQAQVHGCLVIWKETKIGGAA